MKRCPFCAEEIQDAAVKCRYCGSMLGPGAESAGVTAASAPSASSALAPPESRALAAEPLFGGRPSWKARFWQYLGAGVLAPVGIGLVWLAVLELQRRSTSYRITNRAIDVEYGVFSRRIETLQLWRVRDLQFTQSLLDRMLGVAHIHVFTHDVTDPQLMINGLPGSRGLFEQLRSATDVARQARNVMAVVE